MNKVSKVLSYYDSQGRWEEFRKLVGVLSLSELNKSWAFKTSDSLKENVLPRSQNHVVKIKKYLQSNNLGFEETNAGISACCTHADSHLSVLRIPLQFYPNSTSYMNIVSSDIPMYRLTVSAYMDNFGPEDERLQKWLIQNRIDMDSMDIEALHGSTSFRLFPSRRSAVETIDAELFAKVKESQENDYSNKRLVTKFNDDGSVETEPASLRNPYDCAYIIGHQDYRWPKDFPLEGLKEHADNSICAIALIGFPKIYRTHSDGTTIVSDESSVPYLEDIFNPEEGFLSSLIQTRGPYYNKHFMYVCDGCEQDVLTTFKDQLNERIRTYDGWGLDIKPKPSIKGESIRYSPNLDNLVVKIVSKDNVFSSWDFMNPW